MALQYYICSSLINDIRNKRVTMLLLWNALFCSFGYYSFLFLTILQLIDGQTSILDTDHAILFVIVFTGVTYLFYPLMGLAADIYWTRYSVMITGTIMGYIGVMVTIPCFMASLVLVLSSSHLYLVEYLIVVGSIGIAIYQFGLGLFRANAVQFGVDQLEFSNSQKISTFIYLYCWSIHVFRLPCYILLIVCTWISDFKERNLIVVIFAIGQGVLVIFLMTATFFCLLFKKYFIITHGSIENPVRLICQVLLYAKRHKSPVSRSAATYCELPTRLDNGKTRYGGPFTTEQVEAVKSFGRILLLFVTLLCANTVPVVHINNPTNSFHSFYSILYIIDLLQLIVVIPIYLIIVKVRDFQNLKILSKIRIGLVLTVAANLLMIPAEIDPSNKYISLSYAIVAVVLYPISYFLIFYLVLEFIFAQGPISMQGLLIGIWYTSNLLYWGTSLASQYFQVSILKTCLSFLSLIFFLIVSSKYTYRQRNEISDVNRQMIIEQYTERALSLAPPPETASTEASSLI